MWNWPSKSLNPSTVRFHVATETRLLCWAEVLALWCDNKRFADDFSSLLADLPWSAFRWEAPPLQRPDLEEPFEFVVIDAPQLTARANPTPFADQFRNAGNRPVIQFSNLGGDAQLVVPCPFADDNAYAHLASFVRGAPQSQQRALWREVGLAMERLAGDAPVWLSTAGGGVAWLHIRLDESPKYYAHQAYRQLNT